MAFQVSYENVNGSTTIELIGPDEKEIETALEQMEKVYSGDGYVVEKINKTTIKVST